MQVEAVAAGETLNQLMKDGKIDGFIGPRAPKCFFEEDSVIKRLFDAPVEIGLNYFKRTNIFPIMHVLGVKKELLGKTPVLVASAYEGFSKRQRYCRS